MVEPFRSKNLRNNSGNTLKMLSEQILNFQASYGWRSPIPAKQNIFHPQRSLRVVLPTVRLVPFPFWRGAPSMAQPELVI